MVDDDEDDFIIARGMLNSLSYRNYVIDWAASVEQGLLAAKNQVYQAFLVDYRLGASAGGIDFIRRAGLAGYPGPCILLTGTDNPMADAEAEMVGAADFVVKTGLTANELDRSIRYSRRTTDNLENIKRLNAGLEQKVAERTAIIEQLFDNFLLGSLAIFDRDIKYVMVGGIIFKNLGINPKELIGKPFVPQSAAEAQSSSDVLDNLRQVFKDEHLSYFKLPEDTSGRNYAMFAFPLYDITGIVSHIAALTYDITDSTLYELSLKNALEKERELNELKSRFVSMASHEFRTPLTTIKSSASLITKYLERNDSENVKKHAARIQSVVGNLNGILEEFLTLGILEEGKVDVKKQSFDLPELIHETISELKHLLKSNQHIEYLHTGDDIAMLDERLMKNVLLNLLSNAIKYSPEDMVVTVETSIVANRTHIKVTDHGIGISLADQKNLFTRFFRASNVGAIKGTGLGLYIVRSEVELMGGHIHCESIPGKGTTFMVKL